MVKVWYIKKYTLLDGVLRLCVISTVCLLI